NRQVLGRAVSFIFWKRCIVILCCSSCALTVDGPDVIQKYIAEKKIQRVIFSKALQCGYNIASSYVVSELGNDEYTSFYGRDRAKNILYLTSAVDMCLEALVAMPCPTPRIETPTGNIYWQDYNPQFVTTLVLTRIVACTLQPVSFWSSPEPFQGRVY
ncbi:MAG: hypothetical protein AAF518_25680, partial [Spirochaetota bacterium]